MPNESPHSGNAALLVAICYYHDVVPVPAYWLLHSVRLAAPRRSPWRGATFETICTTVVKIACCVEELKRSIKLLFASALPQAETLSLITARLTSRGS